MPLPKLEFNGLNTASITCTCCKRVKAVTAKTEIAKKRLENIFEWVMAAIRSQGYHEGYICPKCEKTKEISTKDVKAWCKKYLTLEHFESRKNVRVIVASEAS